MTRKHYSILLLAVLVGAALYFIPMPISNVVEPEEESQETETLLLREGHLQNGMRVILIPNHRVPAVSHTLWLKIGAADDPLGKSGLAHYLEHLMFKGTPTVPDGKYSSQIEALGGNHNAFTGADFTGYYVNIAKEHLETVMQLELDRFQHLNPSEDTYRQERAVILEERYLRVDNRPRALLGEEINASMFRHHPYRVPIIGWAAEMEALTLADAMAFYKEHYHAGNLVLVVSGDVSWGELMALAEKYYGTLPKREATRVEWTKEPPQRAARRIGMEHALVKQPTWTRHYVAPSLSYGETQHAMALMVLDHWLGGGKTSLLYQALVEKQKIATSVSSSYSPLSMGPSRFRISVTPADGVSLETIEHAVDEVLEYARSEIIDDKTLERSKTLLKADAIYARDGLQPLAQFAGYLAALDVDLSYLTKWVDYIEEVNASATQQAALWVLHPERSVTAELLPKKEKDHD